MVWEVLKTVLRASMGRVQLGGSSGDLRSVEESQCGRRDAARGVPGRWPPMLTPGCEGQGGNTELKRHKTKLWQAVRLRRKFAALSRMETSLWGPSVGGFFG